MRTAAIIAAIRRRVGLGLGALALTLVLLIGLPAPVRAASSWTFISGEYPAAGASELVVYNASAATQTVTETIGFSQQTTAIHANNASSLTVPCPSPPCEYQATVTSSSPELVPSLTVQLLGNSETTLIPAGGFVLIGPNGTVGEAVDTLSATANAAFGSLQSVTSTMDTKLGGASSALGAIQSTLSSTPSAVAAAVAPQIQALDSKVAALTAQVKSLTALLKPKPKPKPKPKRKKRR